MKMDNLVQKSAERFCNYINNTSAPSKRWLIATVAISPRERFQFDANPDIVYAYGYQDAQVLDYLDDLNIIVATLPDRWFNRIEEGTNPENAGFDRKAKELKIITDEQTVKTWLTVEIPFDYELIMTSDIPDPMFFAPEGVCTVIIDLLELRNFLGRSSGQLPTYQLLDENVGMFEFMGQKILFEGRINNKCIELLVNRINSIVSKKEFYEYSRGIKRPTERGVTKPNDASNKTFQTIKAKITENEVLSKHLSLMQDNGYGMFVK